MNCPDCGSETAVAKSVRFDDAIIRQRKCAGCGFSGRTDETWSRSISGQKRGNPGQQGPPVARTQPPVVANSHGGVGGDLPSGIDPIRSPVRIDPDPSSRSEASGVPIGRDRPPRPPRRPVLAAATIPFLEVFDRYPRKYGKARAAQVWQELAETHPGGEQALAREILAVFDRGLLRHPPYSGEEQHRPMMETFLADRAWEDPVGQTQANGDPQYPVIVPRKGVPAP